MTVGGGNFELLDKARGTITERVDKVFVDLRSRGGVLKAAAGRLNGIVTPKVARRPTSRPKSVAATRR